MALIKPLPVPPKNPNDETLVCVQLNEDWIPYIIGILYPMKFHNYWGGTLEENRNARRSAQDLIDLFQSAKDCNDMGNGCCDGTDLLVTVITRVSITGRMEISIDGGSTWQDNPRAPYMLVPSYPPYLTTNPTANKCDVAKNVQEELLRLKDGFIPFIRTLTTIHDFLIEVCKMLAESIAILLEAPAGLVELIPAIFDWAKHLYTKDPDVLEAEFTPEFWDDVLCMIYCNTPANGIYQESDFDNIISQCVNLPGGVAYATAGEAIRGFIKFWQVQGLNAVAANGTSEGADCSACDCACTAENYSIDGSWGTLVSRTPTSITVSSVLFNGQHYAAVRVADGSPCCHITATPVSGTYSVNVWNGCAGGWTADYRNDGFITDPLNSMLCNSLTDYVVRFDFY